jgi:DNA polymerase
MGTPFFDQNPPDLRGPRNPDEPLEFVFVDAETFYSREYSLTHMDPPSYILDPRFETICLGVARGFKDPPFIIDGPSVPSFLNSLPPNVAMVSHNALFDMCILSWRYGYVPKLIVDTLAMARTLLSHRLKRLSLAAVAEHIGLLKGDMIHKVIGMGRADIQASGIWDQFVDYCLNDTALCRAIFLHLIRDLPPEELILHDMVSRCAVVPQFKLDVDVLASNLGEVQHNKQILFMKAMFAGLTDKSELMSNPQFASLLTQYDVTPPTKISKTTGLKTFAFSKQDPEFLALLDHDDLRVSTLVEARLSFKSTIEETRTQRMLNIGSLEFPFHGGTQVMPIPLIVGAAHTHRFGGGWKLNCQNWGRQSRIRKSVVAPEGHKVVTADSRQIEARMNAWFSGQDDLVAEFASGADVYANFASEVYGVPVSKDTNPRARFVGKTGILQLGYQAWWPKFQSSVWLLSYDGVNEPVSLDDDEAKNIVVKYRTKYHRIANMWKWLPLRFGSLIGADAPFEYGPVRFELGRVLGPNGLCLFYHNLKFANGEWTFEHHGIEQKLYGGKCLENIIQFLSRIAVMQAAIRLKKPLEQYISRLTHTSHDEIVYVVPDDYVGIVSKMIEAEMTRQPAWAPGLPLAVDIGVGQTYGDAK